VPSKAAGAACNRPQQLRLGGDCDGAHQAHWLCLEQVLAMVLGVHFDLNLMHRLHQLCKLGRMYVCFCSSEALLS
jgi:hypothetical protein